MADTIHTEVKKLFEAFKGKYTTEETLLVIAEWLSISVECDPLEKLAVQQWAKNVNNLPTRVLQVAE